MNTKTRKTRKELYEEAKSEYLVTLNLQLTIAETNALYRAIVKAVIDDSEPELRDGLPVGLVTRLHETLRHSYTYCEDLALKRDISQD